MSSCWMYDGDGESHVACGTSLLVFEYGRNECTQVMTKLKFGIKDGKVDAEICSHFLPVYDELK